MDIYNMQDQWIQFEMHEQPFLLRVTSSHHYDPKPHGIFVQVFEHDEETNQDGREVSDRIQIYSDWKEQDNDKTDTK